MHNINENVLIINLTYGMACIRGISYINIDTDLKATPTYRSFLK